jgi:hypothetical protein
MSSAVWNICQALRVWRSASAKIWASLGMAVTGPTTTRSLRSTPAAGK